jgi:hypothetical protein
MVLANHNSKMLERASERFGHRRLTQAFCCFGGMGERINLVPLQNGLERMEKEPQSAGLWRHGRLNL